MRTYRVQEIMSVRNLYREPPYPGFSLDEVLRKRASAGTTLTRGDNAWKVSAAKTSDEGVARIVQGALNKLAPEKYTDILESFTVPMLIASERAMQIVIDLIFKKALQEPGYSEMYARLCYDMAMYELRLQATSPVVVATPSSATTPGSEGKRSSKFRENIIRIAQREFQLTDPHAFETLTGEELEEARGSMIKRKKANITFVGQLYMHKVLSPHIMLTIIQTILKTGDGKAEAPADVDIEVLFALLETVGKSLDRDVNREKLDGHFDKLKQLQLGGGYPMRIRFKILDLLELRMKQWEPRVMRADNQAPTTLQEQAKQQSLKALGPRSPTTSCTPNSRKSNMQRFPSNSQFPDSPQPTSSSSGTPSAAPTWRNVAAPHRETPVAHTPSGDFASRATVTSSPKDVPFDKRVKLLITEWVNERSSETIPNWRQRFRTADFATDEELCQAITAEIVKEACIVTKKDAQREACGFLRVALGLVEESDELAITMGLVDALVRAIEEGIIEDVPKFNERFVQVLAMITEKETIMELYCDAAKLLYLAHERIHFMDNVDPIESLLAVWNILPRPESEEEKIPEVVVTFIVDLRDSDQDEIAAALVTSLLDNELVGNASIETWMGSTSAAQAPRVVEIVRQHLQK